MDNVPAETRKKTMQAIKSCNTSLEHQVALALWKKGIRYRKNVKGLFGHPDIAIKSKNVVIFIDSCYWHGCVEHCRMPHSNENYWIKKIKRNIERDNTVNQYYLSNRWILIRIWEHDLKQNFDSTIIRIVDIIN